jgi:hypothetical protein
MKKNDPHKAQQLSLFEKGIKEELLKAGKIVDFLKHKEKMKMNELYGQVDKMLSHLRNKKQK